MSIRRKGIQVLLLALMTATLCMVPAFASPAGNVADAVEQTWTDTAGQIKTVVDTVVFPALAMVLGITFSVKVALHFFDHRKHGQFEWTGAAILSVYLIFVLLVPNYIWNVIGIWGGEGEYLFRTLWPIR